MGYVWPLQLRDEAGTEWAGVHRPELSDLAELFSHLLRLPESDELSAQDWRQSLPAGAIFLRSLGPRTAQIVLRAGSVTDLVVKSVSPESAAWWRFSGAGRRSPSFRAFRWAHRLRAFGIEAPRPLGYLERARSPARYRSFHVTEHIEALSLLALAEERLAPVVEQGPGGLLERRARLFALGRVLADLESLGVDLGVVEPDQLLWDGRSWRPAGLSPPSRNSSAPESGLASFLERSSPGRRQSRTDQLRVLSAFVQRSGGSQRAKRHLMAGFDESRAAAATAE